MLERGGGWGEGCSWGNAGLLVPSHARPIAAPENLRAGLRWMLRRDSPFGLRVRPALAPWLARYVRASTARRAARGEALQRELSVEGLARFEELGIDGGFRRSGLLTVYTGEEAEQRAAAEAASPAGRALAAQPLSAADAKALEPALTDAARAGVLFPHEAHCDPGRLVDAVGAAAIERGVRLRTGVEVRAIRPGAVDTGDGVLRAGLVVVAAGAWSGRLARTLGIRLPLLAGKGYAVDYEPSASPAAHPAVSARRALRGQPDGIAAARDRRPDPRRARAAQRPAPRPSHPAGRDRARRRAPSRGSNGRGCGPARRTACRPSARTRAPSACCSRPATACSA